MRWISTSSIYPPGFKVLYLISHLSLRQPADFQFFSQGTCDVRGNRSRGDILHRLLQQTRPVPNAVKQVSRVDEVE